MESRLEQIILRAAAELREGPVGDKRLAALIRQANRGIADNDDHLAKKHLMPYLLRVREHEPEKWRAWGIEPDVEERLLRLLQVKPRRTASGVATIAVITKPWPCSSDCLYCPNDLRMPKSYVADEPACQRAERNWFDPYLQVASRLNALREMGHVTDKVELIILGGTWNDYPEAYRRWFICELFRALNEAPDEKLAAASAEQRRDVYRQAGLPNNEEGCARRVAAAQARVDGEGASYNREFPGLYGEGTPWERIALGQSAEWGDIEREHAANEQAAHRVVGLVVETRPDAVDAHAFAEMRRLGCTKVQMGIQSLDEGVLAANRRGISVETIRRAFATARLFGFKTHAHFMVNLLGATPEGDKRDFLKLVEDPALAPDEVKLYPCALVAGTDLTGKFADGSWRPYTEQELVDVLSCDLMASPAYLRVSRMIRDIPANDILTGNKKINLRQMVEAEAARRAREAGSLIAEIRHREIGVEGAGGEELSLEEVRYPASGSDEAFLQWVTPDGRIAGFLRLSMPHADAIEKLRAELASETDLADEAEHAEETGRADIAKHGEGSAKPTDSESAEKPTRGKASNTPADAALALEPDAAMIREVHVYGKVAGLHRISSGAQHRGLGRALVERACKIARSEGYGAINVISAVGTRGYYRKLGFADKGLYQQRPL